MKKFRLNVEVSDVEGVVFDELPPRLDGVAHQHRKDLVGFDHVVDPYFEQRALVGIHCRLPELLRVHLAQALVALDSEVFFGGGQHFLEQCFARRNLFAGAVLTRDKRCRQIVFERFEQLHCFLKLDEARKVPIDDQVHTGIGDRLDLPQTMLFV